MSTLSSGIASRLYCMRTRLHLTQEEVGNAIGCSGAHISNIENNKAEFKTSEIEKLASIFTVDAMYMIFGLDSHQVEIVRKIASLPQSKRELVPRLFANTLERMEIEKRWEVEPDNNM